MKPSEKLTIGRREKVDFPKLGLFGIDAKIDTGAFTSSIHCHNIKLMKRKGKPCIAFSLLDPEYPKYNEKKFVIADFSKTTVRSSFGHRQVRYKIKSKIRLFGRLLDIELTLSDREDMKFPVLLGRKLLQQGFVVDVTKYNLSEKQKQ